MSESGRYNQDRVGLSKKKGLESRFPEHLLWAKHYTEYRVATVPFGPHHLGGDITLSGFKI